ncbi:MAG: hypothetical protein H7Y17_03380 [Chlorobia bacterium]|nr:hypothetical protein [Fimbriimonadaceae bacterium]
MKLGFALAFALPIAIASSTQAQIVLKPKNGGALPLRLKAMDSYTLIKNGIAATTMQITFANEANARIEADFIYTLKPGSLVTNFAYWFGNEKVVARVAEKERAKKIYEYITSRMRDPALIELIGKRTFRARVFPIMPHDDLKIEMHFAQALNGGAFVLPLVGNDNQALDRLNIKVDAERTSQTVDVLENIGLTKTQNGNTTTIELNGENYRPTKDLRVTVVNAPAKVQADLYAAKSGGSTGFFTLNLTPSAKVLRPMVSFAGVKVSDVWPKRLPPVKAGQSILVTGRYSGEGSAKAVLRDGSKLVGQTQIAFEDRLEANHPASKLWASMKIEGLGNSNRARTEVVNLSKRFTIPSKHTSWIAIPVEERKRFKQEKAMAEMAMLVPRLTRVVKRYGLKSRQAQTLISEVKDIAKANELSAENCLQQVLGNETYETAHALAERLANGQPTGELESKFLELCKLVGGSPKDYLHGELQQRLYPISEEILKRGLAGKTSTELRERLDRLAARTGQAGKDYMATAAQNLTHSKASELVLLEKKDAKSPKLGELRREIERIETKAGVPLGTSYKQAVWRDHQSEYSQLTNKLGEYVARGDIDSPDFIAKRDRALELTSLVDLKRQLGDDLQWRLQRHHEAYIASLKAHGPDNAETRAKLDRIYTIAKAIQADPSPWIKQQLQYAEASAVWAARSEERKTIRDLAALRRSQEELNNILAVTKTPKQRFHQVETWSFWDPNSQTRDLLVQLLRDPDKNADEIKRVQERLRIQDTQFRGAEWANVRLERLSVETEIDSLQNRELSQDQVKQLEILWAKQKQLRARMGDPMLQVEAPKDARQVVALFPNGEVKPLEFNSESGKWECRFDIPTYAKEGEYQVQVFVLDSAGNRSTQSFNYSVDISAPTAKVKAERVGEKVRVEVEGSEDLARVEVAIGSVKPQALRRTQPGRFFGLVDGGDGEVVVILTDKAHNRTEMKVTVR